MKVTTHKQVINADETVHWKKIPSRTLIAREEKSKPGFKSLKDRLAVLLGTNATGEFKLKPKLTYLSPGSRPFKNYAKSTMPALCKWNNKAWITSCLFITWFTEIFKPAVEDC